jgi:hypothetical protein
LVFSRVVAETFEAEWKTRYSMMSITLPVTAQHKYPEPSRLGSSSSSTPQSHLTSRSTRPYHPMTTTITWSALLAQTKKSPVLRKTKTNTRFRDNFDRKGYIRNRPNSTHTPRGKGDREQVPHTAAESFYLRNNISHVLCDCWREIQLLKYVTNVEGSRPGNETGTVGRRNAKSCVLRSQCQLW